MIKDIEIKEFADGTFQVWRNNQVLRPYEYEWFGENQQFHSFMYYDSLKDAREDADRALKHERDKNTVIKTHKLQ